VPVLPLDTVLIRIDQRNPLLKPYGSRAAAARAYAEGARSWMAPMVGVGTFMAPYPAQMIMDERDKGFGMVSVEQDIPNRAKQRATQVFQQSKAAVEEAARGVTLNRLRSDAKQLYFDWLVLEKRLTVLAENRRILQLMKKLADIRYPYQQGSLGNIYKAQGRLYELDNMVTMTEADIERKLGGHHALDPGEGLHVIEADAKVGAGLRFLRFDTCLHTQYLPVHATDVGTYLANIFRGRQSLLRFGRP